MRDPVVGDTLDQYRLLELVARSGMASIFKAVDLDTNAAVALKIPHVQYESDIVFSERFRREQEVGQTLHHPNIVQVLTPRQQSRIYLVMEFVEGRSLRAIMKSKEPIPTALALSIARQVASALQYLHEQGVVHRDIKPENILLVEGERVKILDFGIALFASERRLTWQGLSSTIGTPDYMAPEQIRGRRGDPRTDVHAVGTLLYEMLTCHLPWDSPNPRALLKSKVNEDPKPPSYWVPGFDPRLEAIVLRALERDPRDRYGSARQLLADLEHPEAVAPRDPATGARRRGRKPVSRGVRLQIALVAIIAALASLVWLTKRSAPHAERPSPPARQGR
ncbi:MAG TPA: serine/threonine-protein kinase [Anaeromyxobacteraceae bacterium]|nr:serine/threonine-protein kinase [Anaeromyxobacteraceae bacterium]